MATHNLDVRAVGRHAVRDQLARIAFDEFCATGFDNVTFADLAGATGVSRSTFLRYFANKEDVVLFVFDPIGDIVVDALPTDDEESDWTALRHAFDPAVEFLLRDETEVLAFLDLIDATPALGARFREKQRDWRPAVVHELLQRNPATDASMAARVRAAAAFECFSTALELWRDSRGHDDLAELLDAAFGALDPSRSTSAGSAPRSELPT